MFDVVCTVSPQVTDDSEMALCMAQALVDTPASSCAVPLDTVAAWYGKWLHSPPYDIGEHWQQQQQQQQPQPTGSRCAAVLTCRWQG
jgi:ADP-ribosylglycohydrolase